MTGPLVPFREIVLKIHSRCDLACDHCYIYEHADQSWRTRPKTISDEAVSWTARRLAEHAATHGLPSVSVILHGGEPLLAGPARLRTICEELGSALKGIAALDLRIHTNGVQLSPRYLDLFDEFHVRVGISLDGDRTANDRHRRYADGRTSHPLVLKAVELLRQDRYRHLDLGLLCTVDVRNDPEAVFDALAELEPPMIDFLLPHATWDTPPPRPDGSATAYADWLLAVFDRWQDRGRAVPVRFFSSILSSLGGGPSLTESLGLAPTDLVVVETDGKLEQVDSLKSAYEGAAATGFDVFTHSFDEVAAHPGVRARQLGLAGVSEECRGCPVVRSCGGGLYTHRYRSSNEFDNPSVYCADLEALVRGIEERAAPALVSPALSGPAGLVAEQHELTRTLLAGLHTLLDGRAGEPWLRAWEAVGALEASEEGAAGLDHVLAHPYARAWLQRTAEGFRHDPDRAASDALLLTSYVAAGTLRAGLPDAVPVRYRNGRLFLPTLGELTVDGAGEHGTVVVRGVPEGFAVEHEDGRVLRVDLQDPETASWRGVRRLTADGVPGWAVDDLDPYRDCHASPAAERLEPEAAEDFGRALARAWRLVEAMAPEVAGAMATAVTTITPLTAGSASERPRGLGALGIPVTATDRERAVELVRTFRRSEVRGLCDVTDLYAADGEWEYLSPWDGEAVPFSRLLAETHERVGLGVFDPELLSGVREALGMMEGSAEPTVHGKRLLDVVRKEFSGAQGAAMRASSPGPGKDD
ncbi:radical SAM/SPASM protein FxsB, inactivated metallohydrolase extension form [Streptomyces sp. NBC_01218]|uniref:radical SAM/SPASM protein FxsBH, inactivated beta-hydroxylase extension form n=1 Tax=unclassified Streptomyces TaxID=2593676 RepID=UPI002E13F31C|nr:radical SAM/SPASM protein FxsB, inactivated metallohydrolase extension form [Streptomyces sp. NBC_01218]